ncbi:YeiH family protein [Corynebacterium alimapuense]|uniref:Putative sulfate exporter family transporter n=1 Tax=Corynebacterium alimapuense TaxID=1576874 RepID=A0A3M8K975_9CORY|nr:YeiH family protein [Corynebacterium alimapuense]RNE49777.1 putative sulfate exporter family transporter [Corynebacterium alimapuense]
MSTHAQQVPTNLVPRGVDKLKPYAPGLILCTVAAAAAMAINLVLPGISPLIIAIVAGIVVTNLVRLPDVMMPGIAFSSKKLLRLGIVFLGLQLVFSDIVSLGVPMLLVIVCVVVSGVLGTICMGRMMKMPPTQVLLISCGFSICGAAAVAGVEGSVDADEEDVVTAVALVVIFGTLMIPAIPLAGSLLGLSPELTGMWAGASIHEIAQVVAAGGIIGGAAMSVAIVVKLARVLLLAPMVAILGIVQRRSGSVPANGKQPAIIPLFIIGFLAMVVIRSTFDLPETVIQAGGLAQAALLSAAMFGLGCGVKIQSLIRVGARPFILAAASTVLVTSVSLAGILLVH